MPGIERAVTASGGDAAARRDYISRMEANMLRELGLTPAEMKVARSLLRGEGPNEACTRLGISESRYRTHVRHMLEKTNSRNRVELITRLVQHEA